MRDFSKPELLPHPASGENWRIYRGNSMRRLFENGDMLLVDPITAGEAVPGDVICFESPDGVQTVHRVIARNADGGIVTMGDNNRRPDDALLSPDQRVHRVRAVRRLSGEEIAVCGGASGLRKFRINRMRRFMARLSSMAAGALRRINPFRITLGAPVRFGNEEVFFFHGKAVAKRGAKNCEEWLSPWFRTFFKIGGPKN